MKIAFCVDGGRRLLTLRIHPDLEIFVS
jgi:hypothetical protein